MQCCPDDTITFINQTTTDIPYFGQYGSKPTVTLLYAVNGVWTQAGVNTMVQLEGNPVDNIHVDHSGPATGFIKIS